MFLYCLKILIKFSRYFFNIVLTVIYGFLHQGGVWPLADHFSRLQHTKSSDTHLHLVTSHIYTIPQSLLIVPSTQLLYTNPSNGQKFRLNKRFFMYEYGSMNMEILYNKMKLILDVAEMKLVSKKQRYQLYLAMPASKAGELNEVFYRNNNRLVFFCFAN